MLFSCNSGKKDKQALQVWLEKNAALNQHTEANGVYVQAKFYPSQLLVLQELTSINKQNSNDTVLIGTLEKKYDGQYYFRLGFSKDNKEVIRQLGSYSRYSEMLQTFSFELGSKINATTDKGDTVEVKDYFFEQNYGLGNANNVLIAFDRKSLEPANAITVHIGEFGLGTGEVNFRFMREKLEDVPKLIYADRK